MKRIFPKGTTPEQAQQMGGRAVFDQLYPEPTRMDAGGAEVVLPQVEVSANADGQLNLSITPPDMETRGAIEKLFQMPSPAGFPDKNELGLYSQLEKEVMTMNLPNWKPNAKKALTPEEKSRLDELRAANITSTADERYVEFEKLVQREREAQGLASGAEVWSKISSLPVKKEELEWSGIEDFLKAGEKFTREEVLDYIRGNGIKIEQVTADKEESDRSNSFNWEQETVDDPDYVNSRAEDILSEYREDAEQIDTAMRALVREEEDYIRANMPDGADVEFFDAGSVAENVAEWLKENFADEIDSKLQEYAQERAQEEYDENPYYRWYDADTGYEIIGNDDTGYVIKRPNGKRVDAEIYSFNEAELQAEEDARDQGYFETPDDETVAKWSQYTMRGRSSNYRELKLTLPEIEGDFYNETHFPDRNIVAFLRVDDRDLALPDAAANVQVDEAKLEAALREQMPRDALLITNTGTSAQFPNGGPEGNLVDWSVEWAEGRSPTGMPGEITYLLPSTMTEDQVYEHAIKEHLKKRVATVRDVEVSKAKTKAYFIDEFQSDWHQDGRQEGYKTGEVDAGELENQQLAASNKANEVFAKVFESQNEDVLALLRKYIGEPSADEPRADPTQFAEVTGYTMGIRALLKARDERKTSTDPELLSLYDRVEAIPEIQEIFSLVNEAADLKARVNAERHGVPDAPFKGDSWISLGLKRALVDAAEGGYEAIAWPNAEVLMDLPLI